MVKHFKIIQIIIMRFQGMRNAHISEFGPFGDGYWSNYFDGTGDYLDLGSLNASLSEHLVCRVMV